MSLPPSPVSTSEVPLPVPSTGGVDKALALRSLLVPSLMALVSVLGSQVNYLLFHVLGELFSIVLALVALVVATTSLQFTRNHFVVFIAVALGWCAGLDLLHTLAFKGMYLLPVDNANPATQLWIAARGLQAVALLGATWVLHRSVRLRWLHLGFGAATLLATAAIAGGGFPDAFIEGLGLTPFKIYGEYLIIVLLLLALWRFSQQRAWMSARVWASLSAALVFMVLSEFTFTRYVSVYGVANLVGHVLKIYAAWYVYLALAQTTLQEPFSMLARAASTYDAVPDPTLVTDREGRILQANRAAAEFAGLPVERLVGQSSHALFHDASLPQAQCPVCAAPQPHAFNERIELLRLNGTQAVECSIAPYTGQSDVPALVQVVRDVTSRHHAQTQAKESEERFRRMIEQTITGIYVRRNGRFIYVNPRFCEITGWSAQELLGQHALDFTLSDPDHRERIEAIWARLDQGERNISYSSALRRKDGQLIELGLNATQLIWDDGLPATIVMAQDITERKKAEDQIAHYVAQLERSMRGTLQAISTMVELRDPYTAGHERRVGLIASAIAKEMGWDAARCETLEMAGLVHDIGKIAVPTELLTKPTRLHPLELELIKRHAQAGYEILKDVPFPVPLADIAHQHHERMDGSGYPQGLKGEAILPEARVLAVADVIESMAAHRPYRASLGMEKALAEVEAGRGRIYDPEAVDAALRLFREQGWALPK